MKTKTTDEKFLPLDRPNSQAFGKAKPKSLRPMRSMVSVRSMKPKATVATMMLKSESVAE